MLNEILIKPPIFIKNIIDMLTDDLKEKKDIYIDEVEQLSRYLNNKYFDRMPITMKIKTAKALWRFCFKNTEDENCKANRVINRKALAVLIRPIVSEMQEEIKNNKEVYTVARSHDCEFQLAALISVLPTLYEYLDESVRLQLDKLIENDGNIKWGAWFKFDNLENHIAFLKASNSLELREHNVMVAYKYYAVHGRKNLILDLFVFLYAESRNFDAADLRFNVLIEPYIKEYSKEQIIEIIKETNANRQIYGRGNSWYSNTRIIRETKDLLGIDFDFKKYPNFKFDEKALNQNVEDSENAD